MILTKIRKLICDCHKSDKIFFNFYDLHTPKYFILSPNPQFFARLFGLSKFDLSKCD